MHKLLAEKINHKKATLCVVGLGYVGLPTATFFAEKGFPVIGCDVKEDVVKLVADGKSPLKDLDIDSRIKGAVKKGMLTASTHIAEAVTKSDIIMIIVPTPTGRGFEPDLQYIISAGESVRMGLKRGQMVILESTVYPGVTEEVLLPILEKSGLKVNEDFGLVYCPERYNPGDPEHTVDKVVRLVGATSEEWAAVAAQLYGQVTTVKRVKDIRTAEMAKIIENTQRDLNIALMNEVALICERMGIDVMDVIEAAATKWNFMVFKPGAGVGGHCLPKDPWYLVKAAEKLGYHAQVVTAGRRVNEYMPHHVFELLRKTLADSGKTVNESKVVVLGLSYKENVGDTRNPPAHGLIKDIMDVGGQVRTVDPYVEASIVKKEFGVEDHHKTLEGVAKGADALVVMTSHKDFADLDLAELKKVMRTPIIVDGRRMIDRKKATKIGFIYRCIGAP